MVVFDGLHRVTGALTPDGTGDFLPDGIYQGKMSYVRGDSAYYIWWNNFDGWVISINRGVVVPGNWFHVGADIEGDYAPQGTYLGTATVTEI